MQPPPLGPGGRPGGGGAGAGGGAGPKEAEGPPGSPVLVLEALEGAEVVVELHSDARLEGTLRAVGAGTGRGRKGATLASLELEAVTAHPPPWSQAAARGAPPRRLQAATVRGSAVRLVVLPEAVDPAAALRRELARRERGARAFASQRKRPDDGRGRGRGRGSGRGRGAGSGAPQHPQHPQHRPQPPR